jgi:hypothetical protein
LDYFSVQASLYSQKILDLAQNIAAKFSACSQVVAIAGARAQISRVADDVSDSIFASINT